MKFFSKNKGIILAVFGILYWLISSVKKQMHTAVIIAIALVLAGAVGNIIDSVFYGVIFDAPAHGVATLFAENPYGTLLHGRVVDMLYFPIYEGESFTFFNLGSVLFFSEILKAFSVYSTSNLAIFADTS